MIKFFSIIAILLLIFWFFSYTHEELHQRVFNQLEMDSNIVYFAIFPIAVSTDQNIPNEHFNAYLIAQSNIDAQSQNSFFEFIQIVLLILILAALLRRKPND